MNIEFDDFAKLPIWKIILLVILTFLMLPILVSPYLYLYLVIDVSLFGKYMVLTLASCGVVKLIEILISILVKEVDK